jgi:hypothetical protein
MWFRSPTRVQLPNIDSSTFPAAAEAHVRRVREVYDVRATWHRRFYRFSGIVVIFAGAGLPLLVSVDYSAKDIVVALTGVLVALVTALRAFYRWDQSWILLRKTEMAITHALWEWRGRAPGDDREDAVALLARVNDIRKFEAESYFKDLAFPAQHSLDVEPQQYTAGR